VTILALDVGTSELKISIFNAAGDALKTVRCEVPGIWFQGSRAEINPDSIWHAVCDGIEALGTLRSEIRSAAISSHGESFVGIDDRGKATGNLILNIDSRAVEEMEEFAATFGPQQLYRKTGLPPHPMYTLPKVAWLRRHSPDVFSRSKKFLCVEDYLLSRLQIEPVISRSMASRTLGFDLQQNCWDSELLRFAGISEQQLSRVSSSGTALGTAAAKVADQLGLPGDVVWCTAGHDQACSSIGAGAYESGVIADGTGTFECASIPLSRALVSPASLSANLPCESHVLPDLFLTLAYVPGGIALKWLRENLSGKTDRSYEAMLAGIPIEPTGIFCFPYFLGTGTPWLDSQARGAIYGLTTAMTPQGLCQAMLEGVCYEMCWNLEVLRGLGIPIQQLLAVGGGAKSDGWLQLKSDIFNCPVVRVPGEASSRGAAICAAMATGEHSSWREAVSSMVKRGRVFEPRAGVRQRYQDLFEQYKDMAFRIYGHKSPTARN
jgi:xylulokinase